VVFTRHKLSMITGPTGSGKTSLLLALLGEMHYVPTGSGSWVNIPRVGGIAYCAQESWVQSLTIRENILFGKVYDETMYKKGMSMFLSQISSNTDKRMQSSISVASSET
jgi:ABC-type transport system involved in cytochrome bd biosynthesis fused ATPase/permease subunit